MNTRQVAKDLAIAAYVRTYNALPLEIKYREPEPFNEEDQAAIERFWDRLEVDAERKIKKLLDELSGHFRELLGAPEPPRRSVFSATRVYDFGEGE